MSSACRICQNSSVSSVDIFAKSQLPDIEPSLAEILLECVDFKVKRNDKLSKNLCKSCISDVQSAYRLNRNFEQSLKKLKLKENDDDFLDLLEAEVWEILRDDIKEEEQEEENKQKNKDEISKRTTPKRHCRRPSVSAAITPKKAQVKSSDQETGEKSVKVQPQSKRKTVQKRKSAETGEGSLQKSSKLENGEKSVKVQPQNKRRTVQKRKSR